MLRPPGFRLVSVARFHLEKIDQLVAFESCPIHDGFGGSRITLERPQSFEYRRLPLGAMDQTKRPVR